MIDDSTQTISQLNKIFGSYKAEWLHEQIYELFTEPTYFPELTTSRPCFLLGGRGTGKTTTLLGLSYSGQFAFSGSSAATIPSWTYFGIFYRVNINRMSAFKGPEVPESTWTKLFAHYLNLLICAELAKFVTWYTQHVSSFEGLSRDAYELISTSLTISKSSNLEELTKNIQMARVRLEATVNTIVDQDIGPLSMQGAPIDIFIEQLKITKDFSTKQFFFLIDEYENFEDYQQRVVNTLIKHAAPLYSFKVGVRELGFRCRTTLNLSEQLISPADYVRVNIGEAFSDERFASFAEKVCRERLQNLSHSNAQALSVQELFPSILPEREAQILDTKSSGLATQASKKLFDAVPHCDQHLLTEIPLLEQYFIVRRAEIRNQPVESIWVEYMENIEKWKADYQNHKIALLFTFGKTGAKNPKLYCGWKTFTKLAHANIRYLLELVDQAIHTHILYEGTLDTPITWDVQTEAAYSVGRKNLSELEGLSVDGARLTKLLLGLGRVFQLLANSHYYDNPEVNQFYLPTEESESPDSSIATDQLLNAAVNHLALVRFRGTKLSDESDTKEYDYMIHPIYAPFFLFSHRLKRKIFISETQLLGLIDNHRQAIPSILKRPLKEDEVAIPVQLELFKSFYESSRG